MAFAGDALGMGAGVVTGMESDLITAIGGAAHQVAYGGILRLVLAVKTGVGADGDRTKALQIPAA